MNKPKLFKNSVRILVPDGFIISRKEIFVGILNKIGELSKKIDFISQFQSNNNWMIAFNEEINAENFFGLPILIRDKELKLSDPNESPNPFRYQQFRLHWLPYGFEKEKIRQFILKQGKTSEIISIEEEYCREEEMTHIKNGNFRIKLRYPKKDEDKTSFITGLHKIDGFKTLFTRIGEKPKCLLCNKEGHLKRECELAKLKCAKCLKIGHLDTECTLANKLKSQTLEENLNLPNEENENPTNEVKPTKSKLQFPTRIVKEIVHHEIIEKEKNETLITPTTTNNETNNKDKILQKQLATKETLIRENKTTASTLHTTTPSTSNKRSNSQITPSNDIQRNKKDHPHSTSESDSDSFE